MQRYSVEPTLIPGQDGNSAFYEPVNILEWNLILDGIKCRREPSKTIKAGESIDMRSVFERYDTYKPPRSTSTNATHRFHPVAQTHVALAPP